MESSQVTEVLILYGTQTGTAQEVAERIGREATRRYFHSRVCSMELYPTVLKSSFKVY